MFKSELPLFTKKDYIKLIEAKAQHDPQYPWFLTEVTVPLSLQSTEVGAESLLTFYNLLDTLCSKGSYFNCDKLLISS